MSRSTTPNKIILVLFLLFLINPTYSSILESEDDFPGFWTYKKCHELLSNLTVQCRSIYPDPETFEQRCEQGKIQFSLDVPFDCYNNTYNVSVLIKNLDPPRKEFHIIDFRNEDELYKTGQISYDDFLFVKENMGEEWVGGNINMSDYCIKIYIKIGIVCEKTKVDHFGNEYCANFHLTKKGPRECEGYKDSIYEIINNDNELKKKFFGLNYSKEVAFIGKKKKKKDYNKKKNGTFQEEINFKECIEYGMDGDVLICLKYD